MIVFFLFGEIDDESRDGFLVRFSSFCFLVFRGVIFFVSLHIEDEGTSDTRLFAVDVVRILERLSDISLHRIRERVMKRGSKCFNDRIIIEDAEILKDESIEERDSRRDDHDERNKRRICGLDKTCQIGASSIKKDESEHIRPVVDEVILDAGHIDRTSETVLGKASCL